MSFRMSFTQHRVAAFIGALVIAIGGAGWIAWAQVGSTGVIYGCVNQAGQIRGIDEATGSCRPGDQSLSWYTKQGADALFLGSLATAADADRLDGLDSTAFALDNHHHDDRYVTADALGNYLPLNGKAADADLLDGIDASEFVRAGDLAALAARIAALEDGDDGDADPVCPGDPACPAPSDVVFLVDTTGDMGGAISNLKAGLQLLTTTLRNENPNTAFAVAAFQDFPTSPFGAPGDQPYRLLQPLTTNLLAVQTAVNALQIGIGGDELESGHEALYQLVTGEGTTSGGAAVPPSAPGFRADSKRIVIVVTSAGFHAAGDYPFAAHDGAQAVQALAGVNAKVIGVAVGTLAAGQVLTDYAVQTGAVVPPSAFGEAAACRTGLNGAPVAPAPDGNCPLVFHVSAIGSGLNAAIVSAVALLP